LSICRAIVESHQGKILATHRPGGGARFTFTLPLGRPPVAALEAETVNG
jgi:two-component system sensor histidine kinase KdpD